MYHPVWLAFGLGFFPSWVLFVGLNFEIQVERPVDRTGHPFVRFRWEPLVGGLFWCFLRETLLERFGVVVLGYGSIYLGTHLVDRGRRWFDLGSKLNYPACFKFDPWLGVFRLAWVVVITALCFESDPLTSVELAMLIQFMYG